MAFTLLQINEEYLNRLRNDARRRELTRAELAAVEAITKLRDGNLKTDVTRTDITRYALDEGLYEVVAYVDTTDLGAFATLTENEGSPWAMGNRITLTKTKRLEAKKNADFIRTSLRQAGHENPESITMSLRSAGIGDIALGDDTGFLRIGTMEWTALPLDPRTVARYTFAEAR